MEWEPALRESPLHERIMLLWIQGADSDERSASYFAKERVQRGKPRYAAEYQWHSPELPPDRLGRYRIGTRPGDEDFTGWVCGAR